MSLQVACVHFNPKSYARFSSASIGKLQETSATCPAHAHLRTGSCCTPGCFNTLCPLAQNRADLAATCAGQYAQQGLYESAEEGTSYEADNAARPSRAAWSPRSDSDAGTSGRGSAGGRSAWREAPRRWGRNSGDRGGWEAAGGAGAYASEQEPWRAEQVQGGVEEPRASEGGGASASQWQDREDAAEYDGEAGQAAQSSRGAYGVETSMPDSSLPSDHWQQHAQEDARAPQGASSAKAESRSKRGEQQWKQRPRRPDEGDTWS
jgi:hypothetical protein